MPYEKRIELARKLNNDRFKKIAKLFGPMQRMAFAENMRKVTKVPRRCTMSRGNDLTRVLPAELVQILYRSSASTSTVATTRVTFFSTR